MENKLVIAGVGVGAFGVGLLVGWMITADRFERKMKSNQQVLGEIIARQNSQLSNLLREKIDGPTEDISIVVETEEAESEAEIAPEGETEETDDVDEADAVPEGETPEETRANLQRLIDNYTANPDDVDTFVDRAIITTEVDHTPPFVISREKYAWDEEEGDEYDKITLVYYPRERLLLDDDEDPIDDVENMVGWRSLAQFGGESGDPDTVFVRNRRLQTDFEVVRDGENLPPIHVRYGMSRTEFESNKAAGVIKFRPEDE